MTNEAVKKKNSFKPKSVLSKPVITTRMLVSIALCSAIAYVLMLIEIAIPIVPSFVKFDFSDLPALICAFTFGPLAGVFVELIKNLLHLLTTHTMGVGELSNFILGYCLVIPAGIIYKKNRTRKGALIGMLVGTLCFAAMGFFSNYFIVFPFYINAMGFPMDAIIEMGTKISPILDSELKLIALCITPYNIFKGVIISILTFLLYKRLKPILKGKA